MRLNVLLEKLENNVDHFRASVVIDNSRFPYLLQDVGYSNPKHHANQDKR